VTIDSLVSSLVTAGYGDRLRLSEPLARYTTFAIGGPADVLLVVERTDELRDAVALARRADVPWRVLGSGSNVLVADRGVRGLVLINRCSRQEMRAEGLLHAESGALLTHVARAVSAAGWAGLAWAVGIPGTIGGAVVNNAGAYGGTMADLVRSVRVLGEDGSVEEWGAERLGYAYRTSALKSDPGCGATRIVLSAALQLRREDPAELDAQVRRIEQQRRMRVPPGCCAGSVFKRTMQYPAGFLIDQAGLKGRQIGGAQVSPQHANFIMNVGGATARDVRELVELVQREVQRAFDVLLEPEIQYIGEWDESGSGQAEAADHLRAKQGR